jgi:4-alpha-glucanotransferase
VLRIDHVMAVHRLWWIPRGMGAQEGAYVRYPAQELLAVIAAEAARSSTTIVGENLGTVPDEVTDALARWDVLGMYEEQFSMLAGRLTDIPARSLAGVRTHDMPAFAAAFEDADRIQRDTYRCLLADAVGHPVGDGAGDLFDAVLERLAASDAFVVLADVDDLLGGHDAHNVPGRVLPSSWRRRLPRPMSAALADLDVRRRVKVLSTRHRSARGAL